MDVEEYRERLMECPDYESGRFIDYLRENNTVIDEDDFWLLIENCKYHTEQSAYYTAFFKPVSKYHDITPNLILPLEWSALMRMYQRYASGWEFKIKRDNEMTISRFHVHFIE